MSDPEKAGNFFFVSHSSLKTGGQLRPPTKGYIPCGFTTHSFCSARAHSLWILADSISTNQRSARLSIYAIMKKIWTQQCDLCTVRTVLPFQRASEDMQCLPRIALSPSAVAVQQLRSFRLLPSLLTEASNDNARSSAQTQSSDIKPSYDMVIAGDGPVSTALACNIGKEKAKNDSLY